MYGIAFASLCAACNLLLGNDAAEKLDGEPDASSGSSGVGASSGVGTSSGVGASSSGEVPDGSGSSGMPDGVRTFTVENATATFAGNPEALALRGNRLLVGDADYLASGGRKLGCAWLFDVTSAAPGEKIEPLTSPSSGDFGQIVALGPSGQIAIADPSNDYLGMGNVAGDVTLTKYDVWTQHIALNNDTLALDVVGTSVELWNLSAVKVGYVSQGSSVTVTSVAINDAPVAVNDAQFWAFGTSVENGIHKQVLVYSSERIRPEPKLPPTTPQSLLKAFNAPGDVRNFGHTLAAKAGVLLIGATGSSYVSEQLSEQLTVLTPEVGEGTFGSSVAVCSANRVVIGAPGDPNAPATGAAYVYTRLGSNDWQNTTTLKPEGLNVKGFGTAVACDGNLVAVSAQENGAGVVYVHTLVP